MRKGLSKITVFSETDFQSGTRIERLYMHLVEPKRHLLSYEEDEYLNDMRSVWTIMVEQKTQLGRIRLISETIAVSERTVRRYMDDAVFLFGDILKVDKTFELNFFKEWLLKLAEKAETDEDIETARKCIADAAAISQKLEEKDTFAFEMELPALEWTTDPKALTQYEDAEIVEEDLLES
jgi:hypothetical protein